MTEDQRKEHSPTDVAYAHFHAFGESLSDPLAAIWSEMAAARFGGEAGQRQYLESPVAQPLVRVPLWAEELAGDVPKEVISDCVGAAMIGYHAVRLQDDLVDVDQGDPIDIMLLSTAAFAQAESLLARHVSGEPFWAEYATAMRAYAQGMAKERWLRDHPEAYDDEAFEQVLGRSRPLSIPGLAVLAWADAWDRAPVIKEIVDHASRALQITNDLRDLKTDLARGNWTRVLTILCAHEAPDELSQRLLRGFDEILATARLDVQQAHEIATRAGLADCAQWLTDLNQQADVYAERFWSGVLGLSQ